MYDRIQKNLGIVLFFPSFFPILASRGRTQNPSRPHTRVMLRSYILLVHALLLACLIGFVHAQAPAKSCCASYYGDENAQCGLCNRENFECRPSHQQAGVSSTSQDCISFTYADETACKAACSDCKWFASSSNGGFGCPATNTSYPPPPPPPPPGQFIDNAPDGACCAAFYGVGNNENANACDQCYGMGNGFTCRDSHQQAGVDKTSKDCISFEYATKAACTATDKTWITPDWNGIGCSRNDTQFLAKSNAHSLSMLSALIIAALCFSL